MIALGKLDRHVGHVAAAAIVADALGPNTNPGMELCERVPGVSLLDSAPDRVNLSFHCSQASDNKIILRTEVTIERHFVGVRSLRDRVDADPPDPVFTKEIPGCSDNALSPFPPNHAAILHDRFLGRSPLRKKNAAVHLPGCAQSVPFLMLLTGTTRSDHRQGW